MFKIKIADIIIEINNKYEYLRKLCKNYIIESGKPEFTVTITQKNIDDEKKKSKLIFDDDYLESICCYKLICDNIIKYNSFLLHGAMISVNNIGYIFIANSGIGKTTHIKLWESLLENKVKIINGDKPIIRLVGDKIYGYGCPWCGKEHYNINERVELKNLCFLKRNFNNKLNKIENKDVFNLIINQIYFPIDNQYINKTLSLLDLLIKKTSAYTLECNMTIDAARVAYEGMSK